MTNKNNTGVKPLAILAAASLSFLCGPLATAAKASDGGFQPQPAANQYLIAQNQLQCTVNSAADPRGGADLRNNPTTGQNIGFVNNGATVNAQQLSPDGKWRWVLTPDGTQQGWMYQPYLNCGGREASNVGSSNMTGGIAIGTTCTAVGSPQYPSVPIRDYPNATGKEMGNFAKGTQLRVVTPPPGQQSQSKWTYVQSVQNPGQQGWVWTNYVSCN